MDPKPKQSEGGINKLDIETRETKPASSVRTPEEWDKAYRIPQETIKILTDIARSKEFVQELETPSESKATSKKIVKPTSWEASTGQTPSFLKPVDAFTGKMETFNSRFSRALSYVIWEPLVYLGGFMQYIFGSTKTFPRFPEFPTKKTT